MINRLNDLSQKVITSKQTKISSHKPLMPAQIVPNHMKSWSLFTSYGPFPISSLHELCPGTASYAHKMDPLDGVQWHVSHLTSDCTGLWEESAQLVLAMMGFLTFFALLFFLNMFKELNIIIACMYRFRLLCYQLKTAIKIENGAEKSYH